MSEWSKAKNILCLRLDAMGDLLMTTPALKALKEALPGRKLTLLTSAQGAKMAESIPLFDEVMTYAPPWLKASANRSDPSTDLKMVQELKSRGFDAAVIFTVYSQNPLPSALLCYLAQIPLRAAYCRENPYQLLTHWQPETEPQGGIRHEVRRHLDLVESLGANGKNGPLVLEVEATARLKVRERLHQVELPVEKREWILIHPGSTAPSRRYHAQGYTRLADLLIAKTGKRILFTGGLEERELIEVIRAGMIHKKETFNLGGELSLKELLALIEASPLLISNNSGPIHMASGLATPVVVLYALTNPQHTPWLVPHRTLYFDPGCGFCYKSVCPEGTNACLDRVAPEDIAEVAMELLSKYPSPGLDYCSVHPLPTKGRKI